MENIKKLHLRNFIIAVLLLVSLISCGGQNRTDNPVQNSIQITSERSSTDAYSALEQLFVTNGNSITNSQDYTGLNRSNIFIYPILPDFNAFPGITQVFNYVDLNNLPRATYQVDLAPGWLYHFKAVDVNNLVYGVNNGNFPVYSFEFTLQRNNLNDPTILEYFTHIDNQALQPNTQNLLQSFLYFPETADCMQNQGCMQRLFITIRAEFSIGIYINSFQFHDISIDALSLASINTITDNSISGVMTSDTSEEIYDRDNKTFNVSSLSNSYNFLKYNLIETNNVLFNQVTDVDFYSLASPPKEATLVANPASIWFAMPYVKFTNNDYYFNQEMSYQYLDNQQAQVLSRSYHGRLFMEQSNNNRWFLYRSVSNDFISSASDCGADCRISNNRFDRAILK